MGIQIIKKDVKHINLKVKPNGKVILTVPTDTTDNDIEYVFYWKTPKITGIEKFEYVNPS